MTITFDVVNKIINQLGEKRRAGKKSLAILLDPDKLKDEAQLLDIMSLIEHSGVDFIFVGGSLLVEDNFHQCIRTVKQHAKVPVLLFPGSPSQISDEADALLFLSLISGRNAELLIGHHVAAAPILKQTRLEIIPTGYMLVDCGKQTTASYISQTLPLPYDKPEIAVATAMAGEMLGLQCMYLDGGSGAAKPVSTVMIKAVSESVNVPLIVGGGIRDEQQAEAAYAAGADLIVIGTAFEEEPELLFAIAQTRNT